MKFLKATSATIVATSAVIAVAPTSSHANSFSDVQSSHQFFDAIKSLSDRGVIHGYQDGTFKPGQYLTRGQAAKIIAGVLGLNTANTSPNFKDIPTNHQYFGAIAALKQAGIINGYENGTFRPGEYVQRNHIAKIISNALNLSSTNVSALPFTDVRPHYREAVAALYQNNVTTGKTATLFDGSSYVTRGQMAAFITRAEQAANPEETQARSVTFRVSDYTGNEVTADGASYTFGSAVNSIFTEANKRALSNAMVTAMVTDGEITEVNSITLNNPGTAESKAVFDTDATLDSLIINADHVSLRNTAVNGATTITDNVATEVNFDGATLENVTVDSTGNLALTGNTNIDELTVTTPVELELDISGIVDNLTVSDPAARIEVASGLRINELLLPAGTTAASIIKNYAAVASQIGTISENGIPVTGTPDITPPTPPGSGIIDPIPIDPIPGNPDPVDSVPTDPDPVDPEPTDPNPTDPEPTDPDPTDPEPTDPDPVDPEPMDPDPTDPVNDPGNLLDLVINTEGLLGTDDGNPTLTFSGLGLNLGLNLSDITPANGVRVALTGGEEDSLGLMLTFDEPNQIEEGEVEAFRTVNGDSYTVVTSTSEDGIPTYTLVEE